MPNNNLNTMRLLDSVQQLLETGRIFSTKCPTKTTFGWTKGIWITRLQQTEQETAVKPIDVTDLLKKKRGLSKYSCA